MTTFPDNFMWGARLSGYRVDGGHFDADWSQWEQRPGRILGSGSARDAASHWDRAESDVRLMSDLGLNTAIVGLEWSRWESHPGAFNAAAERHYRGLLSYCRSRGIEPVCVLQMTTQPRWFAELGGWTAKESVERFLGFARLAVDMLGGDCRYWIPLWEPDYAAAKSYREGVWPPGRNNRRENRRALEHMAEAHRECHALIKSSVSDSKVGLSIRPRLYAPEDAESAWDARLVFREESAALRGFIDRVDSDTFDFVAVSFPEAETIRWDPFRWNADFTAWTGGCTSLSDAETDSQWLAMADALAAYGRDLWVVAGTPVRDGEAERCRRLASTVSAVGNMIESGLPVHGFFHDAFLDGFEWDKGFTIRRGLVHVDWKSFARTPNGSALLMKDIATSGQVREESVRRFGRMGAARRETVR